MLIHKENEISIFFGDAQSCPVERTATTEYKNFCTDLVSKLGCSVLVLQDQIHSVTGRYLDAEATFSHPVSIEETQGDYLITDQPGVAVGVSTADCLPIILFDKRNKMVAAVHAGWKGSLAGIATKTIEHMLKKHFFGPADLHCYFGACAKACCYEVKADLIDQLAEYSWKNQVVTNHGGKFFFNLPLFNKLHLIDLGIEPRNINLKFNECTICNTKYHSNRRNGHSRLCQITAAWL
jgi:YfiH family protein